jgi:hypothetical protein
LPENPKRFTPQELLLNYFSYKQSECLSIQELVDIAISLGCPNADIAQGVLLNLVEAGELVWYKDETGQVIFCRPTDDSQTQ